MERIEVDGAPYELVVRQRGGGAVYRGEGRYLRIGPEETISRHLLVHREMARLGYPVAELLAEGMHDGRRYFTERALEGARLTDIFAKDTEETGSVSDAHFAVFAELSMKLLDAEARSGAPALAVGSFRDGIHLDILVSEMPEHSEAIRERFARTSERLAGFPLILSHGDFNPANMFGEGMIDLEDAFLGPLGYDTVTALITTEWFPRSREYEYYRKYDFSESQKAAYYARADTLLEEHGFPPLTPRLPDFEFCRAVWMTVRMHEWPRIRQYRYDRFVKQFLA